MAEVVITGVGLITSLGTTAKETITSWQSGGRAVRHCLPDLKGTPLENDSVAALPPYDPAERLGGRRMLKFMSDQSLLGCIAAREAMKDAQIKTRFKPERIGLFAGSGLATAGVRDVEPMITHSIDDAGRFSCVELGRKGLAETNPLLSFKILANMPPCLVSIMEEIRGANLIFTPWEGQTGAALLEAWKSVASGEMDCAVTGAADNSAHPATFVYLRQAGILKASEFPASGAAYLVFEPRETARKAGRPIYAVIKNMSLRATTKEADDPLSKRIGRFFAAAPAIQMALQCLGGDVPSRLIGVDQQMFTFDLGMG